MKLYNKDDIQKLWKARESSDAGALALISDNVETVDVDAKRSLKKKKSTDGHRTIGKKKKVSFKRRSSDEVEGKGTEKSQKALIYIFGLLFGLGLTGFIVSWIFNSLTWILISLVVGIWGLSLMLWAIRKVKNGERMGFDTFRNLTDNQKKSYALWVIALIGIVALFIVGYNQIPMNASIPYWIIAIFELRLLISIYEVLSEQKIKFEEATSKMTTKEKQIYRIKGNFFNKSNFIAQMIIGMITFPIVICLLMGTDLYGDIIRLTGGIADPLVTWRDMFNTTMILVAISGVIGVTQLRRGFDIEKNLEVSHDYDRSSTLSYIMMILLPILALIIIPARGSEAMISGALLPGVVGAGGVDYFGAVYVAIIDNPATQFSLVMILIGSLVIIIGKARGQAGGANLSIGALAVAGVPMIIAVMAFVGKVECPPVFLTIFDEGFAQLVFTISYVSVVSLALSIVGIFYEIVPGARAGNLD